MFILAFPSLRRDAPRARIRATHPSPPKKKLNFPLDTPWAFLAKGRLGAVFWPREWAKLTVKMNARNEFSHKEIRAGKVKTNERKIK
jgi:hypothetical protein